MRRFLSIDPGTHGHGVASWVSGFLAGVYYVSGERTGARGYHRAHVAAEGVRALGVDFAVMEFPQVYPTQAQRGEDPNDLLALAYAAGAVAHAVGDVELVAPREWKGQMPKKVCHRRAQGALDASERSVLERELDAVPPMRVHDVLDAMALGLWKLGRL
jgi:hypothetical protein